MTTNLTSFGRPALTTWHIFDASDACLRLLLERRTPGRFALHLAVAELSGLYLQHWAAACHQVSSAHEQAVGSRPASS
jgi:hypothetical protein